MLQANPAADLADAVLDEDAPSYIYTPKGIYKIPHWHFDRDRNCPVWVTSDRWRALSDVHNAFTAASLLNNMSIRPENIVVISQVNPLNPHGPPLRCHWFVRLAVDGNSTYYEEPFGCNYLWQLPYEVCRHIVNEIKVYAVQHNLVTHEISPLARGLKPTCQRFNPKEWAQVEPVEKVSSYFDCMFAMAVKPCRGPVPFRGENEIVLSQSLHRHSTMQTSENSPLRFEGEGALPDDAIQSILEHAIDSWLPRKSWSSFRALLVLRRLNKAFRDDVNRLAAAFFCEMEDAVRDGLRARTPEALMKSRDILSRNNICSWSLGIEIGGLQAARTAPSIYNMMRLRCNKAPGEMPPPPPVVLSAEEAAAQEAAFLRHAPAAFLRRREKRRRIMDGA